MNTMSSSQKADPRISGEEIQETTYPYHHEVNITDGGEFLDDAIRVRDQPFVETNKKENQ